MNRRPYLLDNMHPALQLMLLTMLSFVFLLLFFYLGMYLVRPLFGITAIDVVMQNAVTDPNGVAMNLNQVNALKFLVFMQSFGGFLVPALLFAKLKFPEGDFLRLNTKTSFILVILGIFILITSTPFIDLIYYLNQQMKLPAALSSLEKLINDAEHADDQLTTLLLKSPQTIDLFINLIVIAVIPAIAEELIFRGCVQQVLREWTKNTHIAIWGTAFIFSFIHFQFYGFVPRVLLGAMLGYLFVWSGSLWVPIIAHAFNNGAQVVLAYLHEHSIIPFDITSDELLPVYVTLIATSLCVILLWLYRRMVIERRFIY